MTKPSLDRQYRYEKHRKTFDIVEIATEQIVHNVKTADEAIKLVVGLNKMKKGFQGNTPPFFALKRP